jgi:hypothetical protein
MQLFPTAFWRPGLTDKPIQGDSCYEFINVATLSESDNSYKLNVATTPDDEGDDGVGLYKDYLFSEMVVAQKGLPFTHLNRAGGKKTSLGIYDKFTNPDGVVYATKDWSYADQEWKGWEEFFEEIDGFSNPDRSILDHWLYIWVQEPTFYYSGAYRDLHKTSPVTLSSSADCQTATVTCYFEKDSTQKLFELSEGPATAEKLAEDGHDYWTALSGTVNKFVHWGFNGSRQTVGSGGPWDIINFSYRQKAKTRLKFRLGSAKDLTIKIKGLGTDYHNQFSESFSPSEGDTRVIDKSYFFFDEGPRDQMKRGLYAITPDLILQEKENLNVNPEEESIYAQPGDVQSCTIFFDDEEKIKCVAPVLNYFKESLAVDLNYPEFPEHLKGPVRIFEYKGTSLHGDDGATIKNYEGVGSSSHPVKGLGYIEESEFPVGYGYSRWLESQTIINPYGELWTQDQSYFYDGGSDMITPDYSSPYQYTHTLENVSAGEHTIDVVFDSVAEIFNGGAYYEIEISHT